MTSPQPEFRDLPSILFVVHLVTILHRSAPTVRRLVNRGKFGPVTEITRRYAVLRGSMLKALRDLTVEAHSD